jgi:hypothetical protein
MPTLDDAPTVRTLTSPAAGDLFQVYDISEQPTGAKTLALGSILGLGLLAADVTTVSATSATISTRLTVCTSTSVVTLTLPAASGALRDVTVMKASITSKVDVNRAGSDLIVTGTNASGTSVEVLAGLTARLLSDGTKWYHVSNDA